MPAVAASAQAPVRGAAEPSRARDSGVIRGQVAASVA